MERDRMKWKPSSRLRDEALLGVGQKRHGYGEEGGAAEV